MLYVLVVNILNSIVFRKNLKTSDRLYWVQLIPLAIGAVQALSQSSQAKKQKKEAAKALDYKNPYVESQASLARSQANATRYAGQDQDVRDHDRERNRGPLRLVRRRDLAQLRSEQGRHRGRVRYADR